MIEFLDKPYKATDKQSGFEILVHGFVILSERVGGINTERLHAMCVLEEGVLTTIPVDNHSIILDWRYTRERGWFSIDDPEPEPRD